MWVAPLGLKDGNVFFYFFACVCARSERAFLFLPFEASLFVRRFPLVPYTHTLVSVSLSFVIEEGNIWA